MTSDVPQGSVLQPLLFSIFINYIVKEIHCTLSKFADAIKLSGAIDTTREWNAILKDLDKLKKWAHRNLMRLNKTKGKVLHLGQGSPEYQ